VVYGESSPGFTVMFIFSRANENPYVLFYQSTH